MIFDRIFGAGARPRAGTPAPHDDYWYTPLGGGPAESGEIVTSDTALQVSAVMACVKVLAETIASLPLRVYRRLADGGKELAADHEVYELLHSAPNNYQTSFEFREMLQAHLALRGNAYAEIRDRRGISFAALEPLHPDRVTPFYSPTAGNIKYDVQGVSDCTMPGDRNRRILTEDQVLHIKGLTSNGVVGLNPIEAARNAIGLAMATEKHGARLFKNRAFPGGVLQHPGHFQDRDKARATARSFQDAYSGAKAHSVAILEDGMTWQQMSITPEDAQFLETRQYQVTDIARVFRIPPHMIGDLTKATFSNIEHQAIEFVVHTIRPWLVRWEQALTRKLLDGSEFFIEFSIEGMLRGDAKARGEYYRLMREIGGYSVNDVLALENKNPIGPEGDLRHVSANWVVLEEPSDEPEPTMTPAPLPPTDPDDDEDGEDDNPFESFKSRMVRLQSTMQVFIDDAAERIAKVETDIIGQRIDKANEDQEAFNAWLDEFYTVKHRRYIDQAIAPVTRAWAAQGGEFDRDRFYADAVDSACEELKDQWKEEMLNGWSSRRKAEVATILGSCLSMTENDHANATEG